MNKQLRYYLAGQASSLPRYILEQFIKVAVVWTPTVVGIGLRAVLYNELVFVAKHRLGYPMSRL